MKKCSSMQSGGYLVNRRLFTRAIIGGTLAASTLASVARSQGEPFKFGLTPVFLSNDIELLGHMRSYLASRLGGPVELVSRRTYQEITALLGVYKDEAMGFVSRVRIVDADVRRV